MPLWDGTSDGRCYESYVLTLAQPAFDLVVTFGPLEGIESVGTVEEQDVCWRSEDGEIGCGSDESRG